MCSFRPLEATTALVRAAREHVIVVDASVLVTALADDGSDERTARDRLGSADLAAPTHLDVKFLHALRGLVRSKQVSP